jgi:hypothetical protein
LIDWQSLEDRLFEQSVVVIKQFAEEHPESICASFAYDTDPAEGYFLLSFDTAENSLRQAQTNEQRAIERRKRWLTQESSWTVASYRSKNTHVSDRSPGVDCFAYHIYAELRFPELPAFKESENYPPGGLPVEDDYIEGHVRIVLWRIIERLIADGAFMQLHLASPFHIGYQFHDEDLLVLRILNWPI